MQVAGADATSDPAPPGTVEGRPAPEDASPLQRLVDAARAGRAIAVAGGIYAGDLYLDKALTLVGTGRPTLLGSGHGSVVRVRAADVTIEGFDIDGRSMGDLGRDTAGIHVAAPRVTIRDVRVRGALFGIYLRAADDATIEWTTSSTGIPGRDPGEIGSGIHVWNSQRFHLVPHRDRQHPRRHLRPVVVARPWCTHTRARDLRYGLHYMFSDDNVFEDNVFENGAAGAALMYSKRIVFRRNRFVRNRGFASVGLLLKACDDVIAEDNLIADNARGIFLEGSYRNQFRRNVVAMSDMALVIYDSSGDNVFEGNCVRRQPHAAVALGPPHRHALRRQLLVGPHAARPRRRRHRGPAVPAVERVRSHPRQPDRGRPVLARRGRGGARRGRAGVSRARSDSRRRCAPA